MRGRARSFARKAVDRRVDAAAERSRSSGWQSYKTIVKRVGGEYDVRATRGAKVIRFQYRPAGVGRRPQLRPELRGRLPGLGLARLRLRGRQRRRPGLHRPVRVVGDDQYGLDRDGDGEACEA